MLDGNAGENGAMLDATNPQGGFFDGMSGAAKWLVILANLLGLVMILWGIKTSFAMNAVRDHTLWLDEASLVENYFVKSFWEIATTTPSNNQAAPLLYMWIQKLLIMLFGGSEYVLRIYSVLSYALTLFLVAYIMIRILNLKFGFLTAAFVANIPYVLKYSIIAKSYMSEAAWMLIVLIIFNWYRYEPVRRLILTAIMLMICIAFSNSACFMIGGCMAVDFLAGIFKHDLKQIKNSIYMGSLICAFFALYYLLFLRLGNVQSMRNYWENFFFDLLPTNKGALVHNLKLLNDIMKKVQPQVIVVILCGVSFFVSLIEKNKLILSIFFGFLIMLFASYITMWPVIDRLWIYAYPIIGILFFYSIEKIVFGFRGTSNRTNSMTSFLKYLVAVVVISFLIYSNNGIRHYQNHERVYWPGEESAKLVEYVQNHIKGDEMVYVWVECRAAVKYKIGYNTNRIGNMTKDNILWSSVPWGPVNPKRTKIDAETIDKAGRCWIITSHRNDHRWNPLKTELEKLGFLCIAYSFYNTNLYYYTSNKLTESISELMGSRPPFSSKYQLKGQDFVSGTGSRFLAYGPYMTLPPGAYTLTFYYTDTMKEKGKVIGYVDFLSKSIHRGGGRSVYSSDIRSGETSASVEFMLAQPAERAEFRMFTTVPGVTFKSVTVRRRKAVNDEEMPMPGFFDAKRRFDNVAKRARIDIKNYGTANVVAVENTGNSAGSSISYPKWFANQSGAGCMVVNEGNSINLKITCQKDGELQIAARGMDVRKVSGDKHRVKVLVTYTSIKLDGEEQLKSPFDAWHDQPFTIKRNVKDGQVLRLNVEWKPYHYSKEEFDRLLKELQ